MDEDLQLQIGRELPLHLLDGRQRHFPPQHDAGSAHAVIDAGGFIVQAVGLSADVDGQLGALFPDLGDGAQIGDDDRVRADVVQLPGVIAQPVDLAVFREAVDGDVQLFAQRVGIRRRLFELFKGERRSFRAQLHQRAAAVDGVRAEVQGGFQRFHAPRGSQQFHVHISS